MAIRCGFTVGRNTGESSLVDQLKRYKAKELAENNDARDKKSLFSSFKTGSSKPPNPAHETLFSKCVKVVVDNFNKRPVTEVIPPPLMHEITKNLSSDISPIIGAKYVYDEGYWKRVSVEKYGWHNCVLSEHGLMWKQLFFEKYLQDRLEDFDSQSENISSILDLLDVCLDYIFTLSFRQLPSHIDLSEICALLPNLARLNICYGVNKIGMNYERILFGMKISDATSLAKVFDRSETLTTVILSGNIIDDDLLRMLMTGLIKNNTITSLDVSHNKITNHGARLLSKLLGENSVITSLNLADNQIYAEGGRYLARGLRENDSLLYLNMRLNRLTDDGSRLLLEGLQDNISVISLNISCNSAGPQAAQTLFSIIRDQNHSLQSVDVSGNEFQTSHFELLRLSLASNTTLTSIDLRSNPGYDEAIRAVTEIDKIIHNNEFRLMKSKRGEQSI